MHAELLGVALTAGAAWRLLPGYSSRLANVEAALADGAPLRGWVDRSGPLYAARDREALPHGMAASARRADARWDLARPLVRGLGKLPWVEAVAVVGALGRGSLHDVSAAADLVVIAEGGRTRLARAAIDAYRRGRRASAGLFRVVAVLDADALSLPEPSADEVLGWTSLRPVTHPDGWRAFVDSNPWLGRAYPNWSLDGPELPDRSAGARLDGKLAAVRRTLVSSSPDAALLGGADRKGRLPRLEERFERRLRARATPGIRAALTPDLADRYSVRWAELATWEVDEPAVPEPPRSARPAVEPSPSPRPEPEPPAEPSDAQTPEPAELPLRPRARRSRPARGAGRRSSAAGTTGQRGRGARRKRRRKPSDGGEPQ